MAAVRIIGKSQRVVDAPGLTIDELAGNVASKEDRISIAFVVANKGTAEPFLTLHYDEWICVKKGKILFENDGGNVTANAGDTVLSRKVHVSAPLFWKIPNIFRYVCQHLDLIDALEKMEKIKKGKTLPRILKSSTRLQKKL